MGSGCRQYRYPAAGAAHYRYPAAGVAVFLAGLAA
jgi:hypothetical protein